MLRRRAGTHGFRPEPSGRAHKSQTHDRGLSKKDVIRSVRKRRVLKRRIVDDGDVSEPANDAGNCDCGCDRHIKRRLSLLLQRFFASKQRWMDSLKVERRRPAELERVSAAIQQNGLHALASDNLDLDTIELDISRQQWISDHEDLCRVRQALLVFCLVNNVGYWQGLHDVAAALVRLKPKPSVGELAAILEKLIWRFAAILMRTTDENIVTDASKMAAKWRLMFLFFFPRAATDLERVSDSNSWNINWFLTLGFYRFGCAYIALAYAYTAILCSAGCMTAFMYHELGYLGIRGYMTYRLQKNQQISHPNANLFEEEIGEETISRAVTNSKMILLTPEELINVSRNLYDTLNDKECEMAEFPILPILKMSNFLYNRSPLILYKNHDLQPKNVVQIGISDIFKENETQRPAEAPTRQSQVVARELLKRVAEARQHSKISDRLNNELLNVYLKNLYANVLKKSFIFPSRFEGAIARKATFTYHIIDVRSQYLTYGEALQFFFGDINVTYLTDSQLNDFARGVNHTQTFTVWLIVTDDGFENPSDSASTESLNRGIALYWMLSRTCTGVAILKGGYKALLKWKKLPVPAKINIPFFKKIMDWMPMGKDQGPKIAIQNVVAAIDDTFSDLSGRIKHEVTSRIGLFRRNSRRSARSTDGKEHHKPKKKVACMRYVVRVAIKSLGYVTFGSNGAIKLNGIIWHPSTFARHANNPLASVILYLANLFQITSADGFQEIVPRGADLKMARDITKRPMSDFGQRLTNCTLLLHRNRRTTDVVPVDRVLSLAVKMSHRCAHAMHKDAAETWWVTIATDRTANAAPLAGEMVLNTYIAISLEGGGDSDYDDSLDEDSECNGDFWRGKHTAYNQCWGQQEFCASNSTLVESFAALEKGLDGISGGGMVERGVAPIDLSLLNANTALTYQRAVPREPSICSERRPHVFSRRIKSQSKSVEVNTSTPNTQTVPTNAVNRSKNVFLPRNQLKRALIARNISGQGHNTYSSV
ncbi:TBC domain-containing protein, putative [Babesia ovata]|uniref:TBC domain-containing protein, putative n=1 Tax=Babesia ovata TaxID=189622 RepID=A0A2H6KG01_9APIC|nr:TBC domain-containing protein, putative [Babesia ovata]GBE61922.1 TBC domain-containing protein, putative [Babesia ovata]